MIQSFTPTNPAAGTSLNTRRSLPFQARSVLVTSGPNWVTLQPDGYTIPPGTVGLIYSLGTADAVATFMLTAPPVGTPPLGPIQQQQSYLEYSDEASATTPGSLAAPPAQPIATLQLLSQQVSGTNAVLFNMGLAKAFTFVAATLSQNPASLWSWVGVFGVNFQTIALSTLANSPAFPGAAGQGTVGFQSGGVTEHIFPSGSVTCTEPFVFDARLYY